MRVYVITSWILELIFIYSLKSSLWNLVGVYRNDDTVLDEIKEEVKYFLLVKTELVCYIFLSGCSF